MWTLCIVALTTFSVIDGSSVAINTDRIDAVAAKLTCITEQIQLFKGAINSNTSVCNLWLDLYFPLVMEGIQIYGCENERTQQLSDSCAEKEINAMNATLLTFLRNLYTINIGETRRLLGEFTQCGWDVPKAENLALVPLYRFVAFPLKNMEINVKHIKCVTFAIGSALFASELAKDWLIFHIQLIRSASTIYACKKLGKYAKFICIISEFKNAAKILLNVWKFIIEKKLTELIVEVKKSIQERCHANQPNLIEAQ